MVSSPCARFISSALALNACNPATVTILNGFEPVPIGTWVFELNRLDLYMGYESCSYFVKWINPFYPTSANLFLEELITPGYMDCEMNSTRPFAGRSLMGRCSRG